MKKLVFGGGYLGERVARRWQEQGAEVHVVTRSVARAADFATQGFFPHVANINNPKTLAGLPPVETVLFAVGYDRSSSRSIQEVYEKGLQNVLAALPEETKHVVYISSTGVYGDAQGEWVDERTPPAPHRPGGKASLAAEQVLTEHSLGSSSAILRLAGIYGPGRVPHLEKILQGESLRVPSESLLNLIHVEDAADVVLATEKWLPKAETRQHPALFCVSDGHPVARHDFYTEIARLVERPTPRFESPDPQSPVASRAQANKKVSNRQLIETFNLELTYPTYQTGLAAILGS